jgi:hypothetical protein
VIAIFSSAVPDTFAPQASYGCRTARGFDAPSRQNDLVDVPRLIAYTPPITFASGHLGSAIFKEMSMISRDHNYAARLAGFTQDGKQQAQIF